jgi:hypothetical protein
MEAIRCAQGHLGTSMSATIVASLTMLPIPNMVYIADLLAPLASSLFDTLLAIPYSDVPHPMPPYAPGSGDHDLDEPCQRNRVFYPASSCLPLVLYLSPPMYTPS